MPWFYVNAGQRIGPVTDVEFERLLSEGVVQPATMVWRAGMTDWQPYSALHVPAQALCANCQQSFPADDVVIIDNTAVCAACKPAFVQRLQEGVIAPPATHFAGFGIRALASLIDGVLHQVISVTISLATGATLFEALGVSDWMGEAAPWTRTDTLWLVLGIAIDITYQAIFVARFGGTVGKLICRIRVIRVDGQRLSYRHALGRAAATYVSLLPCGIGLIMAAFDSEKRTLHDRICGTRVIWLKQ